MGWVAGALVGTSRRLPGADITGQLSCRSAQLTGQNQGGNALDAGGMKVGGDVFLDAEFTAAGAVRLPARTSPASSAAAAPSSPGRTRTATRWWATG